MIRYTHWRGSGVADSGAWFARFHRRIREEIRRARSFRKLSLRQAAMEAPKLNATRWARLEKGDDGMTLETLAKVAEGLGAELEIRFVDPDTGEDIGDDLAGFLD